jgi:glutathione S-transferase
MPTYRLHYFPESGNSYKLALMLTLCGERFEPVWTDFGGGVTRTAEWRRDVNPMGEIPVLKVRKRLTQRADPAHAGKEFSGSTADRSGAVRTAALVVLGQPQAHRLHGDLPLLPAFTPSPDGVLKHFAGASTTSCRLRNASGSNAFAMASGRRWLIFR